MSRIAPGVEPDDNTALPDALRLSGLQANCNVLIFAIL